MENQRYPRKNLTRSKPSFRSERPSFSSQTRPTTSPFGKPRILKATDPNRPRPSGLRPPTTGRKPPFNQRPRVVKPPVPLAAKYKNEKGDPEMQILEGKHKGIFLKSSPSPKVRPTARRMREVLFALIHRRIRACRFLDLCAGSGAVGIEAISRGALLSTFVERSGKMCSLIKKNMEKCEISIGHGEVIEMEVVPFLKRMKGKKRVWDVVFFDPPYNANYDEVLEFLSRGVAVRKNRGIVIIEHHAEMFFPEQLGVLKRWRVIVQGETAMSFYERRA
jgi:16S rRNA (guanine(966)-N(2))-methyltransferase RsmD